MDEQLYLIRGRRITNQLKLIEESTIADLQNNIERGFPETKARQHATNPVQVTSLKFVAYPHNEELKVQARVTSNGHRYQPIIMFQNVIFTDSLDTNATTFKTVDVTEHIVPIELDRSNVKVRCTCLDFYHRFSKQNRTDGSFHGRPMPPYHSKGSGRPPVNPQNVPGVCKHLLKLVQRLEQLNIIK